MGDSHNDRRDRFHGPDGIVPNGFFDHPGFYGFVHQQEDMNLQSQYGTGGANGQVQDDQYLQRGFYSTGPSHLQGSMAPPPRSRQGLSNMNLNYQHPMQTFGLQLPDMSFAQSGQTRSHVAGQYGNMGNIPIHYGHHQGYQQPYQQIGMGVQARDDDDESVFSATTDCDSNCGLADPCTEEECADREDACTDRLCPEKDCPDTNCPEKMPSEVVVAAATLAAFGGGLEPAPHQANYGISRRGTHAQGLASSQQDFFDGFGLDASFNAFDVVKHIGTAHVDDASSNCTGPCPIDNPQIFQHFQHCPFPNSFDFDFANSFDLNNPFLMNNNLSNQGPFNFSFPSHEGCGAEISDPEALVEHFNTQHRHALENVLAQGNAYGGSGVPQLTSSRTSSSTSSNALERSLSSATHSPQQGSFPPTPLSLCHDVSGPTKSSGHQSRASTVSQPGTSEWDKPQCLWCNPVTGQRCGQVFSNSEALFAHVNGEHIQKLEKGASGFLCHWENCKRRGDGKEGFPQRSKIERHMITHIGRKPFECKTCGQRFSAQQALTQHLLIHSDERPLVCDWEGCGKTFRQQSALTMHRRCHTGEKPLKCPVCGKAFSESSNLSKHKRIHEPKARYPCHEPGCNKSFHRLDQLRRHMKLHPGMGGGAESEKKMMKGEEILMDDSAPLDAAREDALLQALDAVGEQAAAAREPAKKKRAPDRPAPAAAPESDWEWITTTL
ncbi:hypothetical protein GE09DRAFT_327874 [Coniochaeta sp. 2T2.1]|nr:hypothetical protein GE09DRAFT_327874 [Coniochaeta sp. 2T2.1]